MSGIGDGFESDRAVVADTSGDGPYWSISYALESSDFGLNSDSVVGSHAGDARPYWSIH